MRLAAAANNNDRMISRAVDIVAAAAGRRRLGAVVFLHTLRSFPAPFDRRFGLGFSPSVSLELTTEYLVVLKSACVT